MNKIVYTESAHNNILQHDSFYAEKNIYLAAKPSESIYKQLEILKIHPRIGRLAPLLGEDIRELIISFGKYGFVAYYKIVGDTVYILGVRHGAQSEYKT